MGNFPCQQQKWQPAVLRPHPPKGVRERKAANREAMLHPCRLGGALLPQGAERFVGDPIPFPILCCWLEWKGRMLPSPSMRGVGVFFFFVEVLVGSNMHSLSVHRPY